MTDSKPPKRIPTHPVSFRLPAPVVEVIADLQQRLATEHPFHKPPSQAEVVARALVALDAQVPGKRAPDPLSFPHPVPAQPDPPPFGPGDAVWSATKRSSPNRPRYRVEVIGEGRRHPSLLGRRLDFEGQVYGGQIKLPSGAYEKAPEGVVEGSEPPFEGPRFYVKPLAQGGWAVFERFNQKDEIQRGRVYADQEVAYRAIPWVAQGIHYPRPAELELDGEGS